MHTSLKAWLSDRRLLVLTCVILLALLIKFFWPAFVFRMPLGYDPGFYRYLFLRHAEGFPPFVLAELEPWARGHPLGLFFFSTAYLKLGLPLDWLTGWIWNLFPVMLAAALALAVRRTHGSLAALGTLVAALLSVSFFDGFALMYWKTYASLFWMVLAFGALDRRSWLVVPFGVLVMATHHQTGLLFGLAVLTWALLPLLPAARSTERVFSRRMEPRRVMLLLGGGVLMFGAALLLYLPIWQEAVAQHIPALLGRDTAAAGSFPAFSFYMRTQGLLLAAGAYGWLRDVRQRRWTPWQLAVLWCLVFISLRLLFYRRFFLQLDFFLLPFAGIALAALWQKYKGLPQRIALIVLCLIQLFIMQQAVIMRSPIVEDATFDAVLAVREIVPAGGYVLALEDKSAAVLRGWVHDRHVGGPGLFESAWALPEWEVFLLDTPAERMLMLSRLPYRPVYILATPYFRRYYGEYAEEFLRDPCLEETANPMLFRAACLSPDAA